MPHTQETLRQPVVVVLGHVDSGKCVDGRTLIQLADGRILPAEGVFSEFKHGDAVRCPDGEVFEARGLEVLSVGSDGGVAPRRVSHVWKLRADRLTTVRTKAGYDVRCTPEHKFLVISGEGRVAYAEAGRLKLGDRLLLPSSVPVAQNALERVKEAILAKVSDGFLVRTSSEFDGRVESSPRGGKGGLASRAAKGCYRASAFRRVAGELGLAPSEAYDDVDAVKLASRGSPWVRIPKTPNEFEGLSYVVGLLHGEGAAGSRGVTNASEDVAAAFSKGILSAFGVGTSKMRRRSGYVVSHKGGASLARFLADVFGCPAPGETGTRSIPQAVLMMPDGPLAAFLRGLFDAGGFVRENGGIGACCRSAALLERLPMVLQRFGCLASLGRGPDRQVRISGREHVGAFVRRIGFADGRKMLEAEEGLLRPETDRVFGLTSLPGELPEVAGGEGLRLASLEAQAGPGRGALEGASGHKGAPNDYAVVQVTGLEEAEGGFTVYDFTVDDYHNFLANGLIIHNTSLLDKIRGTAVQAREAGGITQEIGASFFPMDTLLAVCGSILDRTGAQLRVPGLLVIDTPGHEIFSNLRVRGGSAADIAILVVDVQKGLENQTLESIEILRQRKVPFLVALNKIDMIRGWRKESKGFLASVLKEQAPEWNDELEERLYNVVGGLSRLGFESDAYYRVKDFRKQVSLVPVSARYGVGIPELLAVLIGLAQHFLTGKLAAIEDGGRARGIILELQEEVGIGETANVILTEGKLKVGDRVVLVKRGGATESRVKALFMPKPLDEMRDPRDKFTPVAEVYSAAGVKLVTPDLEGVIPGTSLITFANEAERASAMAEVEKDLGTLVSRSDKVGVVVKAGSIGGLEALLQMLDQRGIPVRLADIGDISKSEITEAEAVAEHDPYLGAVIGFDVKVLPDAREGAKRAQIVTSDVIYDAIEGYVQWSAKRREEDERTALSTLTLPAKVKALRGNFFRRNDPAIFGVEVLAGRLRAKVRLMDGEGKEVGVVEQIQDKGKVVPEAAKGAQVAISVKGPTLGRQIKEEDELYSYPTSHETKVLRSKFAGALGEDCMQALEEIIAIRSAVDALYGF